MWQSRKYASGLRDLRKLEAAVQRRSVNMKFLNMSQIYMKTPVSEFLFNKIACRNVSKIVASGDCD